MIEKIFIRAVARDPQIGRQSVQVIEASGIEGDRYFNCNDEPGQNLTLVEAEVIEQFLTLDQRDYDLSVTGRNLVTRGIRLNDLLGKEFTVGQVRLLGVDLCHPCSKLGKVLASQDFSPAAVARHFAGRGGLRADVLSSGIISVGDNINPDI